MYKTFSQWLKFYSFPKEVRDKAEIDIKIWNDYMRKLDKDMFNKHFLINV